jgi:two-component system chemotaxis response regulator CheY
MLPDKEEHTMDGQSKKVLVAEDCECIRKLLACLLEQAQYEVHLAGDGYEALGLMRNGVFDAVITDWDMPRLNGSELLALCRIFWPETPVIVISAHAVPSPGGLPHGTFAWLSKPYVSEELLRTLGTATQQAVQKHQEQSITATSQP